MRPHLLYGWWQRFFACCPRELPRTPNFIFSALAPVGSRVPLRSTRSRWCFFFSSFFFQSPPRRLPSSNSANFFSSEISESSTSRPSSRSYTAAAALAAGRETRSRRVVETRNGLHMFAHFAYRRVRRDFKRSRSYRVPHTAHSECRRLPSVMVLLAVSIDRPPTRRQRWNSASLTVRVNFITNICARCRVRVVDHVISRGSSSSIINRD